MALPALQNRTVRTIIILIAVVGVLVTVLGLASLSYRQTRNDAIQGLENKVAMWGDAIGLLLRGARNKMRFASETAGSSPCTQTINLLRRFISESTIYRSAMVIQDGKIVGSYTGWVEEPTEAPPALLKLGEAGDIRLVGMEADKDSPRSLAINFNTGMNYSLSIIIPGSGIAELMRYGDRQGEAITYFVDQNGVILDRSVNAPVHRKKLPPPAGEGLSETENEIALTRQIPGYPYFIVATLSKSALFQMWSKTVPLYAGMALAMAACLFVAARMATAQTMSLESELREAARLNQVVAHYQPILNLQTGQCAGVEVLMRWRHPQRGLVPPVAFIPEAERTGVITQLTECLMVNALNELTTVFSKFPDLHAAINVPVQTLTNPAFPAHVDRLIRRRFNYKQISFELTESTSLNESALHQLRAMKDLGIRLAVDDFGTGYSNLRYLSIFPFDFLKIDKAFVDGISVEGKSSGFVDQIVAIGRTCGLQLIAEGIEHAGQADYLTHLGVEFGQGFLFAAPMPIGDLMVWLEEHKPSNS